MQLRLYVCVCVTKPRQPSTSTGAARVEFHSRVRNAYSTTRLSHIGHRTMRQSRIRGCAGSQKKVINYVRELAASNSQFSRTCAFLESRETTARRHTLEQVRLVMRIPKPKFSDPVVFLEDGMWGLAFLPLIRDLVPIVPGGRTTFVPDGACWRAWPLSGASQP